MHAIIENNKPSIIALCKKHEVKEFYVFGSVIRDDYSSESDIDFLIVYKDTIREPDKWVANDDALKCSLQDLLQKEIDLVQYEKIQNRYLRYFINQEKRLLYAEA